MAIVALLNETGHNDREHRRAQPRRFKIECVEVAWMVANHKTLLTRPVCVYLCRISRPPAHNFAQPLEARSTACQMVGPR